MKVLAGLFLLLISALADPPSDDFTCSPSRPCRIGCCSNSGVCGLGPEFCGPGNCTSTCNYKSECDPGWGSEWSNATTCPLNVCCSKYGFCGTTSDFCGTNTVTPPSCSGSSASHITVGYYEGWSMGRACDGMAPEDIPYGAYSHLNFAFAFVDPESFNIAPMSSGDVTLYPRFTKLKQLNPILKTYISIGGWSMNDPNQPTAATFSNLAGSPSAQDAFFSSLTQFMANYGFDGVDIDWEYPVAPERSGKPADYENYVSFLKNLRDALNRANKNYGLTITIPSSYWYMRNFDIVNIAKIVNWFNLMSYDLHGTWDSTDPYIGAVVNAHTNLTETQQSLDLLWRNKIDPAKVVLGLGFYGRSFTLSDPSCNTPGCPFAAGGNPGPCTASAGTLSYSEIQAVIASGAKPVLDEAAAVKMMTWNTNQWVSYDDEETLGIKLDYANSHCLGGTMVWAATTDTPKGDAAASVNSAQKKAVGHPNIGSAMLMGGCAWTACGGSCLRTLKSVITDSGEKGGFLGDLAQLFGKIVSAGVGIVVGIFVTVDTESLAVGALWTVDGYLLADLGLSAGADALTQSCHNNVKKYCCPPQDPPTCHWLGTAPGCGKPQCGSDEFVALEDSSGDGHRCWSGHKTLCCSHNDTTTGNDTDLCPMVDGFWDVGTILDSDGMSTDFVEYDIGDDDCPDPSEAGHLSKRGLNATIAATLFERWVDDPSSGDPGWHLNHLEKRGPTRTYTVCDRSRRQRNRLQSQPYPPVDTLNINNGVEFAQQDDPDSCTLRDMDSSTTRRSGLNYVVEHVMELNFPSWSAQGMIDGVRPGGGTLTAGPADYTSIFGTNGFLTRPWSQLGNTQRTGTPMDSLYGALGTNANTGNLLILERRLNGLKAVMWRGLPNIIAPSRWNRMGRNQRIAALNSVVNVFDYLNGRGGGNGRVALQAGYDGMLSAWTDFASAVRQQGLTYDFVGAFREYARGHFSQLVANAERFITGHIDDEITYWQTDGRRQLGRLRAVRALNNLRDLRAELSTRLVVDMAANI